MNYDLKRNFSERFRSPSKFRKEPTRRLVFSLSFLILGSSISLTSLANPTALRYDQLTQGTVPIPSSERELQTVIAEPWFRVTPENRVLEGATFDRKGNLLFCDVSGKRILRITPDKQISTVFTLDHLSPGGLAIHKDGRIFIAALDLNQGTGAIFSVQPNGSGLQTIISPEAGYMPNDLVFDTKGGFYFSDFKGNSTHPQGGIYYVDASLQNIQPILSNLSMANGVALSPNGKTLWATEFGRNLLHKVELSNTTTIAPIGTSIPYHFTGPAPDSMRVDADGNVYVAIYGQGRVLAFNKNGIPIGQVLLPHREQGQNLQSTSLAIRPDTNDIYVVTNDEMGEQGATIFHSQVFGKGWRTSFQ